MEVENTGQNTSRSVIGNFFRRWFGRDCSELQDVVVHLEKQLEYLTENPQHAQILLPIVRIAGQLWQYAVSNGLINLQEMCNDFLLPPRISKKIHENGEQRQIVLNEIKKHIVEKLFKITKIEDNAFRFTFNIEKTLVNPEQSTPNVFFVFILAQLNQLS